MLTINHLTPEGAETTYSAEAVTRHAYEKPHQEDGLSDVVASVSLRMRMGDKEEFELLRGVVYVMNSEGKTVNKHDLGGWKLT